jgi:hypothetical protein
VLTPLGRLRASAIALSIAASAVLAGCAGGSSQVRSPSTTTNVSTDQPRPAKTCLEESIKLLVHYQVPGKPDTAQIVDSVDPADCSDTIKYLFHVSPAGEGYCTEFAVASDYPSYDLTAQPSPPLDPSKLITFIGAGCGLTNTAHPVIT